MNYPYKITIAEEWDGESFPMSFGLKEHEAWKVADAVEAEDSHSIPCLGGRLANEVYSMLESIV